MPYKFYVEIELQSRRMLTSHCLLAISELFVEKLPSLYNWWMNLKEHLYHSSYLISSQLTSFHLNFSALWLVAATANRVTHRLWSNPDSHGCNQSQHTQFRWN